MAPRPVCRPVSEKPSFSRLYFRRAKRSTSSSIKRIFFISQQRTRQSVTRQLRCGEFRIKGVTVQRGFFHRQREEESGTLPDRALHARGAVVGSHQVLDNREPQTGAAEFPGA